MGTLGKKTRAIRTAIHFSEGDCNYSVAYKSESQLTGEHADAMLTAIGNKVKKTALLINCLAQHLSKLRNFLR